MTVLEFLRDRYCGKIIKYYVRIEKFDNGKTLRYVDFPEKCWLPEWVERGIGDDHCLVKDVETFDKVVSVNPFRNAWKLETLKGDVVIMTHHQDFLFKGEH